jgi:CubicO group peptidase (beta-lactamase class C family)
MHALILLIFLTFLPPAPTPQTPNFTRAADYSTKLVGQAVLVQQGGQVIFERYDNNWSADAPHPLASGTKSFTGVAAIFAVQDGLLTLDELAADTPVGRGRGGVGHLKRTTIIGDQ